VNLNAFPIRLVITCFIRFSSYIISWWFDL